MAQLDSFFDDLRKDIEKFFNSRVIDSILVDTAQYGAELIRERTRRGFGVPDGSNAQSRLKPLAESTKKSRRSKKKRGKLSSKTSPGKSNLTDTGQLLDALYGRLNSRRVAEIALKSRRRGGGSNDEVAFFVSAERQFLNFSKSELKKLDDFLSDRINQEFDKALRKYR